MKLFLAMVLLVVTSVSFAHGNPCPTTAQGSLSLAGGLVASQSGASSDASGSVSGNGSSKDSASNTTQGDAGIELSTTKNGVEVQTGSATSSSNKVKGSKSGNASGSASGDAGSTAAAAAGGGAIAGFGSFKF